MACRPDEQKRLTVVAAREVGNPANSAAIRATDAKVSSIGVARVPPAPGLPRGTVFYKRLGDEFGAELGLDEEQAARVDSMMEIQREKADSLLRHRSSWLGELSVVVANDVRVFNDAAGAYAFLGDKHPLVGLSSRALAKLAAEIYAGHGIIAYLPNPPDDHATLSTPELSFLIATMGAVGGMNGCMTPKSASIPRMNG